MRAKKHGKKNKKGGGKIPTPQKMIVPKYGQCLTKCGQDKKKRRQNLRSNAFMFGARYRTRTCDLLHVKQMLYQLS